AERWWPGVSICQRLAYRVLAACWDAERHIAAEPSGDAITPRLQPEDAPRVSATLDSLAQAWQQLTPPPPLEPLPELLQADVEDLRNFLDSRLR
ncbi:MAG TPA: hypothetical protein PK743_15015, partial [Luteimonas sp.]|nr:hypothetical protein [Luteimonas sp.]